MFILPIKAMWNSMKQRVSNLLGRIDRRLRSAKKKEQLQIMNENQLREQEQAELRELKLAAALEWKRRRARTNRSRAPDATDIT